MIRLKLEKELQNKAMPSKVMPKSAITMSAEIAKQLIAAMSATALRADMGQTRQQEAMHCIIQHGVKIVIMMVIRP